MRVTTVLVGVVVCSVFGCQGQQSHQEFEKLNQTLSQMNKTLQSLKRNIKAQQTRKDGGGGGCYTDYGSQICAKGFNTVKVGIVLVAAWGLTQAAAYAGPTCFTALPEKRPPIAGRGYLPSAKWTAVSVCSICCKQ